MKVEITLVSRQSMDGDTAETVTRARGTLDLLPDSAVLTYTTTEDGDTDTTSLTIEAQRVTIDRRGTYRSRLILEQGQTHLCRYETPYGTFTLGVTAHRIGSTVCENGGCLQLAYALDMGGSSTENEIEITIKEVS